MDLDEQELKATRALKAINKIVAGDDLNFDDYIHKDKIKEQIKKHKDYLINQAVTSNPTLDAHYRDLEKYAIQVLEELLEGK